MQKPAKLCANTQSCKMVATLPGRKKKTEGSQQEHYGQNALQAPTGKAFGAKIRTGQGGNYGQGQVGKKLIKMQGTGKPPRQ